MSNIPELRFKEFSGEWEEKKLGEIAKIKTGSRDTQDKVENGKYPFFVRSNTIERINSFSFDGEAILTAGDGVGVGKVFHYLHEKFDYHQRVYNIHSFNKDIFGKYIYFYFTKNFYKRVIKLSAKNSVDSVRMDMISQMPIPLPKKQEQQKIASFLTTIDTKIEQLTKKVELQEQYKKGVMQKIFSGEIRFKNDDGSEFDEWEEMQLKDFLILTLREVPKPKENYLAIGVRSHCKGTFQRPNSEPHKIAMDKLYKVKENDLIVSITFAWESAIAIVNKNDEGGLVSHRFPTYTFKKDKVIVEFFRYVIIQKKFRFMLDLISPGGAGRNRVMSKKDFLKLKWILPPIEEQTKIANFLSTLDKQIDSTKEQLAKTKEFKKGLLQRMFI